MTLMQMRDAGLRVAMVSMHTSPLDQPGSGDAGGLNVYVAETARRLAASGADVDVFTRATSSRQPDRVTMAPGVEVFNLAAGPFEGLRKNDLPGQVCPFTAGLLREAAARSEGYYDVVHSHYWLSGQAGWLTAERWSVPFVHTMHTMAKVKNEHLADGDDPEPLVRVVGEQQLVAAADRLVANTSAEADDLIRLYDADPHSVAVVHPGVDLETFGPGSRADARRRLGLPARKQVVLFVGRIQPLKAPDLVLRAVADLVTTDPARREDLHVVVCGGPSGNGLARPDDLAKLAADTGITDLVEFVPPVDRRELADYYRAADLVVVPSHSESFGLVALEAQASGTPVLAADVGGLSTAVAAEVSGRLLPDHDVATWSRALGSVLDQPRLLTDWGTAGVEHAHAFSWSATAAGTLAVYQRALAARSSARLMAVN